MQLRLEKLVVNFHLSQGNWRTHLFILKKIFIEMVSSKALYPKSMPKKKELPSEAGSQPSSPKANQMVNQVIVARMAIRNSPATSQ